jgi:hypothetical protein
VSGTRTGVSGEQDGACSKGALRGRRPHPYAGPAHARPSPAHVLWG